MKYRVLTLLIAVLIVSCNQTSDKTIENNEPVDSLTKNNAIKQLNWCDSLIMTYVRQTENPLVKSTREANVAIDWQLDRIEDTDSATYLVFHIGHDMTDEGNINPRFATDAWIYVDSLKRVLFEYDLPTDQLIRWTK